MLGLPSFGARRAFENATSAASAGKLDDAASHLREYFSLRYHGGLTTLKGADADAAVLAATCAILRGDAAELEGVGQLVEVGEHATTAFARRWIEVLRAAMKGDVRRVLAEKEAAESPALSALMPAVLLVAAERGLSLLSGEVGPALRAALSRAGSSPEIEARVAVVLASLALSENKRAEAQQELARVPAGAPELARFLAALAREDEGAARAIGSELAAEDRPAAAGFCCRLAVGASAAVIELYLALVGPFASAVQRASLVAALATALTREGAAPRALGVLEVERQRSPGSSSLAMATAFAALAAGNPAVAAEALKKVPPTEASGVSLKLASLAAKGDHEGLLRELPTAEALPANLCVGLAPLVLAALMKGGVALSEQETPAWLRARPNDPSGLYAWGVMRLRQGAARDALDATEHAIKADPSLQSVGDTVDAARVAVACEWLAQGQLEHVEHQARAVRHPRQVGPARRVLALARLARLASARGARLDASTFGGTIDALLRELPAGEDRDLIALLALEAQRMIARGLLQSGRAVEAKQVVSAQLGANAEGDAIYLASIADLLASQGVGDLANVERQLLASIAREPTNHKNHVLLAEVRGARDGAEAKLATLEPLRRESAGSPLLREALASAYGRAQRGLEAKKVGFLELRRVGTQVPPALADQIRAALGLEAPPAGRTRRSARETRAEALSLLSRDGVEARVHLLIHRATAAAQRSAAARASIDPAIDALKRAVVGGDLDEARTAEVALVQLLGRAS